MPFNLEEYLSARKELVEQALVGVLCAPDSSLTRLEESINYSITAGGKRLRPILAIAAGEAVGGDIVKILPVSCALEMIHTYSLIHDDLPSMDDDALRRGRPTNHSVYGEAVAILAGDALLTDSFYVIAHYGAEAGLKPREIALVIGEIAHSAGSRGMVGGQALDLFLEGRDVAIDQIETMHRLKTATMIEASVVSGGIAGGASDNQLASVRSYAGALGLAFQIIDDILDVEGGEELGKERGSDERKQKASYASTAGIEAAKKRVEVLTDEAVRALNGFDSRAQPLREIAAYLGKRKY